MIGDPLCVDAQPWGEEDPATEETGSQADRDPCLTESGSIHRTGQAQKQPAAEVTGVCAERRDETAEPTVTQHEVGLGIGAPVVIQGHDDHHAEVDRKGHHRTQGDGHHPPPPYVFRCGSEVSSRTIDEYTRDHHPLAVSYTMPPRGNNTALQPRRAVEKGAS